MGPLGCPGANLSSSETLEHFRSAGTSDFLRTSNDCELRTIAAFELLLWISWLPDEIDGYCRELLASRSR